MKRLPKPKADPAKAIAKKFKIPVNTAKAIIAVVSAARRTPPLRPAMRPDMRPPMGARPMPPRPMMRPPGPPMPPQGLQRPM
jgi:hypothetical protein